MRSLIIAGGMLALVAAGLATPARVEARPGGCLKYGAAGAVAGHAAGHHAVKGALVGCAVGMYRRHQYNKEMRRNPG